MLTGYIPCLSAVRYAAHVGENRPVCPIGTALGPDLHCYDLNSVWTLALALCWALWVGLFLYPKMHRIITALCQDSLSPAEYVGDVLWCVLGLVDLAPAIGAVFAFMSLFTDMVTPFEQVWLAPTNIEAATRFASAVLYITLAIAGNWWSLVAAVGANQVVRVEASGPVTMPSEGPAHLFARLVGLTIVMVWTGLWLAYCWIALTTYGRPVREVIGWPSRCGMVSAGRYHMHMFRLWLEVFWRKMTFQPLLCVSDLHEERFRHYVRKEWVDKVESAPCHDKTLHGHPTLAAERRGVHLQAVRLLSRRRYVPYDISTSRRTLRAKDHQGNPISGFHGHFSARDYGYPERNDEVSENTAFLLIDVDYYIDIHQLATHFKPMVLYTFNPGTEVGHTAESSWSTTYDSETREATVRYNVDGGNVYTHKLWDYGDTDYVVFASGGLAFVYAIERHRQGSSTHQVVFLQPNVVCALDSFEFRSVFASCHVVGRRKAPEYVRKDGDLVTIVDDNLQWQLRAGLYQTVMDSVRSQKAVSAALLHNFLKEHIGDIVSGDPQYLSEWIAARHKSNALPTTIVYASVMKHPKGGYFRSEMVETHEVMTPVPTNVPAFTPTKDVCSDAGAVQTRITDIHNSTVPPPKYDAYLKEFIAGLEKMTSTPAKSLVPLKPDELLERTERKKTAAKILGAYDTALSSTDLKAVFVEGFIKREVYTKPSDERQISPTNDEHLSKLAPYAYVLKDMLCKLPNYMPGKTPREISEHMQKLMTCNERLWETDFSRYDGQQSRWMRNCEVILFSHFFKDPAAAELVYNEVFRVAAKCPAGSYDTGGNLCSGSSLTTIMNTWKHMFIQYCTYRESGLTHEQAMAKLFAAYGDDGVLTGDEKVAKKMAEVCDDMGMKNLKCVEAMTQGRRFLTFVGRVFLPAVEGIHAPSFQDPTRVWTKINLIQKGPDAFKRYVAKLGCYVVTDGNSPLLGEYCRKVLTFSREGREVLKQLGKDDSGDLVLSELFDQWLLVESKARVSQAWPNSGFHSEVEGTYCQLLGITLDELQEAKARVTAAQAVEDLNGLLKLPDVALNPRFVYKDFALSYGKTLVFDNNKKTGAMTAKEKVGIRRTFEHVLGKGTCLLDSKGTKLGKDEPAGEAKGEKSGGQKRTTKGEKSGGQRDKGNAKGEKPVSVDASKGKRKNATPEGKPKSQATKGKEPVGGAEPTASAASADSPVETPAEKSESDAPLKAPTGSGAPTSSTERRSADQARRKVPKNQKPKHANRSSKGTAKTSEGKKEAEKRPSPSQKQKSTSGA